MRDLNFAYTKKLGFVLLDLLIKTFYITLVQAVVAALIPIQSQDVSVTAGSPANRPEGTVITVTQGGKFL